jgi:hypothetical protein
MSFSIWARPLTDEEEVYFRKSDLGRQTILLGRITIMGPANQFNIMYLDTGVKARKVHLGEGQYIYDMPSPPPATGGKKVQSLSKIGFDLAYHYLLAEAKNLNIPVIYTAHYPIYLSTFYFQSVFADAFLESLSYADRALHAWYNEKPFLARWFGSPQPTYDSSGARAIREKVGNILANVKTAP